MTPTADVVRKLSFLDRYPPVWIVAAMVAGLVLGGVIPGLQGVLDAVKIDQVPLPIALGLLLLMMYPVLAKVRYDRLHTVTRDRRTMVLSLVLNWILGSALMFALAWPMLFFLWLRKRWPAHGS